MTPLLAQTVPAPTEFASVGQIIVGLGLLAGNVLVVWLFLDSKRKGEERQIAGETERTKIVAAAEADRTAAIRVLADRVEASMKAGESNMSRIADKLETSMAESRRELREVIKEYHELATSNVDAVEKIAGKVAENTTVTVALNGQFTMLNAKVDGVAADVRTVAAKVDNHERILAERAAQTRDFRDAPAKPTKGGHPP